MKFITKEIYYSMQFYSYFLAGIDETELLKNNPDVQKEYRFYMKQDFNQYIFAYNKVKDILFDEKQMLYDLDRDMYCKILDIAKIYKQFQEEQFLTLKESTEKIQNGNYSENIKFLTKYHYHDCKIISIMYDEELLYLQFDDFSWSRYTEYVFEVEEFIHNISLEELKKFTVLYEEMTINPSDNIFEYNVLLNKWDKEEPIQIEEISIKFTDIKSILHVSY